MNVEEFYKIIGSEFYTGVPDSLLKPLCSFLMSKYGIDKNHHLIAANEGNCVGLAAGYYMATSKIPVVYMQNSGEGNVINPLASLLNDNVYAIPVVFIIGWRGEPGVHDEPQHIYQGIVTETLMKDMDVATFVISRETSHEEVVDAMNNFRDDLKKGKQVAFIIRKGALEFSGSAKYKNDYSINREEAIQCIADVSGSDLIVSTTGKISRELFEIRERNGSVHNRDFLTVGAMGHCSSIALGIALNRPDKRVWCIDGDGAVLMHMGALAVIGSNEPSNLIHVIINNGAHETVGGMPTVSDSLDFQRIGQGCGYKYVACISDLKSLKVELEAARKRNALSLIEVKCSLGSRPDLGRPTTTAIENKENFMRTLDERL